MEMSANNDPQYILNLLKSVITASLETMKIGKALPTIKERNELVKESATK